jgi:hypothetical protein
MASAMATIGDTMEQVIEQARRDGITIRTTNTSRLKMVAELFSDGSMLVHQFRNGMTESSLEIFSVEPLTPSTIADLQRSFHTEWYAVEPFPAVAQQWKSSGNSLYPPLGMQVAYHMGRYDYVCVYVIDPASDPTSALPTAPPGSTPDIDSSPERLSDRRYERLSAPQKHSLLGQNSRVYDHQELKRDRRTCSGILSANFEQQCLFL